VESANLFYLFINNKKKHLRINMASQVLSGANNASYTNNTGQNVRLIINYMSNVTSMTWAGVTVTATRTTIGKNVPVTYSATNFTMTLPQGRIKLTYTLNNRYYFTETPSSITTDVDGTVKYTRTTTPQQQFLGQPAEIDVPATGTLNLVPSTNTNFPVEIMLASGETFSSTCDAYNAVVIKEDGT